MILGGQAVSVKSWLQRKSPGWYDQSGLQGLGEQACKELSRRRLPRRGHRQRCPLTVQCAECGNSLAPAQFVHLAQPEVLRRGMSTIQGTEGQARDRSVVRGIHEDLDAQPRATKR